MALATAQGEHASLKLVNDSDVPGGRAVEFSVTKVGSNAWSSAVNWTTSEPIAKGDTIFLAYWAKGISAKNEAQTATISRSNVQQSAEPWEIAATNTAYLTPEWAMYYASGIAPNDIAPGESGLSFQAGLSEQVLRLGPAYVLNFGPGVYPQSLPQTKITYQGRDAAAPWRADAMAKINQHRKADLTIRVTDASGKPLAGVPVRVAQQSHDFHFGSFVNHSFVAPESQDDENWQDIFKSNFNTATLPLYWQDWGWKGENKKRYLENIDYADSLDLPWRGHPILWPGAVKMPTSILKNEGDIKKQRQQVLDHVRDVMDVITPYSPIAIDMVNETRDHQYFRDQGDSDLIADAFRLAHEIAPDIPLYVNDYGILNGGGLNRVNVETYKSWIRDMKAQNVPVGGIGFQGHFGSNLTSPDKIMNLLGEFSEFGLPMQITEFDIETQDEDAQADYTRDFILAMFSEPSVDAFIMWGFWEGTHWKTPAAMVRKDWTKKPNYDAWRKTVYDRLWTDATVTTDANGMARLRGFKGDYAVSAKGQSMSISLTDATDITLKL